jgi:release factor glutamine methyltransferase
LDAKRFIALKALDLKQIFHNELNAIYGKNEVETFYFLSTEYYFNISRLQLALDSEFTFSKSETEQLTNVLHELKAQKPIQYILGETDFYGLKFKVNSDVLIPRPETEELIDWIIKDNTSRQTDKKLRILDIGTGSGCIAISLAKQIENATVYALDVSNQALDVARTNTEVNQVNIQFIECDILDESSWNAQIGDLKFDIIVSNPPYVRYLEKQEMKPNVLDNEPSLALFVDDENPLKFYNTIAALAVDKLNADGQLYFEINQYLGKEMMKLLDGYKFEGVMLRKDLNGNDRMIKGHINL